MFPSHIDIGTALVPATVQHCLVQQFRNHTKEHTQACIQSSNDETAKFHKSYNTRWHIATL